MSAISSLRKEDEQVKITLVDPKAYSELLWAAFRTPFDEELAKGTIIRLEKFCATHQVEFVQATVTKLTQTSCQAKLLASGKTQTIDFDVCVLATGASAPWQGLGRDLPTRPDAATAEYRLAALKKEGQRLSSAKSVVIVGGGMIGCELAGDLVEASKEAKVTLVHSSSYLCHSSISEGAADRMKNLLEEKGVTVILNEKATQNGKQVTLKNSGKVIDAELVVMTTGFSPLNSFVGEAFPDALDERGWIRTDPKLVVPGTDGKIFAFGDCSSALPTAGNVYFQNAPVLGHNVTVALTGADVPMKEVSVPFLVSVTTVGKDSGVAQIGTPFWTVRFLPWLKNSTMFLMTLSRFGATSEHTLANE